MANNGGWTMMMELIPEDSQSYKDLRRSTEIYKNLHKVHVQMLLPSTPNYETCLGRVTRTLQIMTCTSKQQDTFTMNILEGTLMNVGVPVEIERFQQHCSN